MRYLIAALALLLVMGGQGWSQDLGTPSHSSVGGTVSVTATAQTVTPVSGVNCLTLSWQNDDAANATYIRVDGNVAVAAGSNVITLKAGDPPLVLQIYRPDFSIIADAGKTASVRWICRLAG